MSTLRPPLTTKAARTQQRIVEVAISQFAERGIRATSIASVAKLAGVSPASVFGYFGSKEDLFRSALDADILSAVDDIRLGFASLSTQPVLHERWGHVWSVFSDVLDRHPLLHRVLVDPDLPVFPRILTLPEIVGGVGELAAEIRAAQFDGLARSDVDPQVAANGLTTAMIAVILTHAQTGIAGYPARLDAMLAVLNSTLRRCPAPVGGGAAVNDAPTAPAAEALDNRTLDNDALDANVLGAPESGHDSAAVTGSVDPSSTLDIETDNDVDPAPATRQPGEAATKGERTRDRILEVAVRLFAITGSKGTSVAQIAREVGITPAAVFAHFSSKRDLFSAAFNHDVTAMLVGIAAAMDETPIHDRWPNVVEHIRATLHEYPLVERVIAAKELEWAPSLIESDAMRLGIEGLADQLAEAQFAGTIRDDLAAPQLAEGLADLAACFLIAQSQNDGSGQPDGWTSRLEVLRLALQHEPV